MSVIFREAYSDTSINMGHLRHECVSEMDSLESFFENSFEKSVSEFYGHHITSYSYFHLLHISVVRKRELHHGGTWLAHHIFLEQEKSLKSQLEIGLFGHQLDFI